MKTSKPDLSKLWEQICMADDMKSFEVLYTILSNKLIRFCVYYVGKKEVAEEIVSEVFVKCWENRKAKTDLLNPESYFFAAVRNQSLKHIKKSAQLTTVEIESSDTSSFIQHTNPENELENKELHIRLDQAIEKLPPQAKTVFRLIKESGMKYKEVADLLEISPRTVQTQLVRAIAKLRVTLQSYYQIDHKKEENPKKEENNKLIR